jgi:hypothetical protein
MQEVEITISVGYREGHKIDRSAVCDVIKELFLSVDRSKLFDVCKTEWAGYTISLAEKKEKGEVSIGGQSFVLTPDWGLEQPTFSDLRGGGSFLIPDPHITNPTAHQYSWRKHHGKCSNHFGTHYRASTGRIHDR